MLGTEEEGHLQEEEARHKQREKRRRMAASACSCMRCAWRQILAFRGPTVLRVLTAWTTLRMFWWVPSFHVLMGLLYC